ncbi:Gamma-glutamyl phosphate reductase [Corynebacterium caspium DSM 44850]|nr:glutamate-5-semialdehyde dehydrogenase [Corynebacterium caspium]WKD58853.1 Gamma-glutamyl phosphate reductase [Corynebacterium caspium DSM 44850]
MSTSKQNPEILDAARRREYEEVYSKLAAAKAVARQVGMLSTATKNGLLLAVAAALEEHSEEILAANKKDLDAGAAAGLSAALLDRLSLDENRIKAIAQGVRKVANLPDPIGEIVRGHTMANGIQMRQIRVPLGVMGMVYEARPNVTVDAFSLALKSGNAVVLRGSKTALESNKALVSLLKNVLTTHRQPADMVQLLPCESHDSVQDLITARGLVDVVIPRGSSRLIAAVVAGATVPTIETGAGNCHFYIDRDASLQKALAMVLNGKTRRTSVCNATETVLIDSGIATSSRYSIISELQRAGVTIHGDAEVQTFAPRVIPATDEDWAKEYLSMDIAVRFVDGVDEAIAHINKWSTGHTEGIATQNYETARRFAQEVDAAAIMINASTAFTDGEEYGMGAEIGISTQKLHARGPMGLVELTSTKWILEGNGQIRP